MLTRTELMMEVGLVLVKLTKMECWLTEWR